MALEDTAHQMFSTVPEVLAGVVALLGAFTLFRVGGLQRRITELGEAVLAAAGVGGDVIDKVRTAFSEHRRREIHAELDRLEPYVAEDRRKGFDRARARLDRTLRYRKSVIDALTTALWTNIGAIVVSVVLLMFTQPLLAGGPGIVYGAMAVVVGGLIASFAANTRVLYRLLG